MRRIFLPALFLVALILPGVSSAASLSISPSTGTYSVGDQVTIRVLVASDVPLNAVSGVVSLPASLLSIQSVSKANSILNFWVSEPTFSMSAGTVQFEGVALSGYQGDAGTVVTIRARALKTGSGTISFQSGQVLANDGQGTDISSGLSGGSISIVPAKEKSVPLPTATSTPAVAPEPAVVATRSAPVISPAALYGQTAISGTSKYPLADVVLTFVPVNGSKLFITGTSDEDGSFTIPAPLALRNGAYAVSAVMMLKDGSKSDVSNVLTVEVGGVFVADVSWESATYMSLALILLLILLVAYFVWHRYFGPKRKLPEAMTKEIREAEQALEESFDILQQELADHLKKVSPTGEPSKEEIDSIDSIKKDFDEAKKYVGKEIKDIELIHLDEKE